MRMETLLLCFWLLCVTTYRFKRFVLEGNYSENWKSSISFSHYLLNHYYLLTTNELAVPCSERKADTSQIHVPKQREKKHQALALILSRFSIPTDILALLLSDVVVLLQEKDQKLVFAAVVSSPQTFLFLQYFLFSNYDIQNGSWSFLY